MHGERSTIGTVFKDNKTVKNFPDLYKLPNVTSIVGQAFQSCSIEIFVVPDTFTYLPYIGMRYSGLKYLDISSNVSDIGDQCFMGCTGLETVIVRATTPPVIRPNSFNGANSAIFYVPASALDTYKSASVWSNYASRIQAIPE